MMISMVGASGSAVAWFHFQSAGAFLTWRSLLRVLHSLGAAGCKNWIEEVPRRCRADRLDLAMTRWAPLRKLGYPVQPGRAHPFPGIAPN